MPRQFYVFGPDLSFNPPGLVFENEELLRLPGMPVFGPPDVSDRGLRPFVEPPRFHHRRRLGRKPRDIERLSPYWLVSQRAKAAFEAVDAHAFDFAPCEMAGIEPPVDYWLCDVVRVIDVVDETSPRLRIRRNNDRLYYSFPMLRDLRIHEKNVGSAHVFRPKGSWANVICDEAVKTVIKSHKLLGFRFDSIDAERVPTEN